MWRLFTWTTSCSQRNTLVAWKESRLEPSAPWHYTKTDFLSAQGVWVWPSTRSTNWGDSPFVLITTSPRDRRHDWPQDWRYIWAVKFYVIQPLEWKKKALSPLMAMSNTSRNVTMLNTKSFSAKDTASAAFGIQYQAYGYRTYSTTEDDQLEKDRLLKLDRGAYRISSLLQLDNDLFLKKTRMASWDGNRCGAFSTSKSSLKMTRWTLKGCCYNESPCDVYRSEVAISIGSYLKRSICPSDKELIAHMDELVAWASLEPPRAKNEDILNQMMCLAQGVFVIQMSPMMTKSSRQRKGSRS